MAMVPPRENTSTRAVSRSTPALPFTRSSGPYDAVPNEPTNSRAATSPPEEVIRLRGLIIPAAPRPASACSTGWTRLALDLVNSDAADALHVSGGHQFQAGADPVGDERLG